MHGLIMIVRDQETGFLHPIIYKEYDRTKAKNGINQILYKSEWMHKDGFCVRPSARVWIQEYSMHYAKALGITQLYIDTNCFIQWNPAELPPMTQSRLVVIAARKSKPVKV
jgi:hypothetical protein